MSLKESRLIDESVFNVAKNLGTQANKAYIILNGEFEVVYCNELYTQLTGYTLDSLLMQDYSTYIGNEKSKKHIHKLKADLRNNVLSTLEIVHKKNQDLSFGARLTCIPMQVTKGEILYQLVFIEDITNKRLQDYLQKLEQNLFGVIEKQKSLVVQLQLICEALDGIFAPHGLTSVLWYTNNGLQLVASPNHDKIHLYKMKKGDTAYNVYNQLITAGYQRYKSEKQQWVFKDYEQYIMQSGYENYLAYPFDLADGQRVGALLLHFDDDTRDHSPFHLLFRKLNQLIELIYNFEMQKKNVDYMMYIDHETHMPNRAGIIKHVEAMTYAPSVGTLQIIEPTDFLKMVELYGQQTGNALLKQINTRLNKIKALKDTFIGRLSSSSLMLLTVGKQQEINVDTLFEKPFLCNGQQIFLSAKSGIVHFNEVGLIEKYMRCAESALNLAKQQMSISTCYYDKKYDEKLKREMQILNHLALAIQQKQFDVFVQPKVNLKSGKINSLEALARWSSPELGFVMPDQFIPIAERTGLIYRIEYIIIEKVLRWLKEQLDQQCTVVPVAINISPSHFYKMDFLKNLQRLLAQYNIPAQLIIIEITENVSLVDVEKAHATIKSLKEQGFIVSIDDFGIGYSSLSYLQKLSFNELKIDRSFTWRLHEVETEAIVRSIIQIAHNLNITVVAEGVETKEQARKLLELGCNSVQGYYYYKPMPLTEVMQYL